MTNATTSKTDALEVLRLTEVKERQQARELELAATSAQAEVDASRETLINAHADGEAKAIKAAENARTAAMAAGERASIEAAGARRRAERTAQEREQFTIDHAAALIEELTPAAFAAAERIENGVREIVEGDAEWKAIRQRIADLSTAGKVWASGSVPDEHGLASIVHELRRGVGSTIVPPLPRSVE